MEDSDGDLSLIVNDREVAILSGFVSDGANGLVQSDD